MKIWEQCMARIEKTVFISYRRKDISWALAVYQYLISQKYDVFFDYTSIPSGDFEQIIVSNIRARAHFVLILTPTALDRCSNPADWLRREIETAIDERRNIIPLFFDGFNFGAPNVAERLTGKLAHINRYNGLDIPSGYFMEGMERLRNRYLNIPLNAVIHPVPTEVRKVVKEEQIAANQALRAQKEDIKELVKPAQEKIEKQKRLPDKESPAPLSSRRKLAVEIISSWFKKINPRPFGIGIGILLVSAVGIFGINSLIQNLGKGETPSPTNEVTRTSTVPIPTSMATAPPFTPTPELGIDSTMPGVDGMTLLYVPAGEFTMGSIDGSDDEKPVHTVDLDAFWIDQTEVTNAMFADFIDETGHTTDAEKADKSWVYQDGEWNQVEGADWLHPLDPSSGISDIMDHPVVHVSWNDATAYCSWVDRRLPVEAEWEKAASWDDRNQQKYVYPWGNDFNGSLLNYCDTSCSFSWADKDSNDGYEFTAPVGTYPNGANPYGALDMAGNVLEWVDDWYDAYPGNTESDSDYGTTYRVLRGGAWVDGNYVVRSAFRFWVVPTITSSGVGFRCASSQ
jgi:formylglycine-generating enzyme required for sulfatase activity